MEILVPESMWHAAQNIVQITLDRGAVGLCFALIGLNIYREKSVGKGLKNISEVQGKILEKLTSILESMAVRK